MTTTTLTAKIPAKFAQAFGMKVEVGEGGNLLTVDTGKPVEKVSKEWAAKFLKKNEKALALTDEECLRVSSKNKTGGDGRPLRAFIIDMVKLSHSQGHLTLQDLADLAGLSIVGYGTGNKDFRNVITKIVKDGCLTSTGRGRTAGEAVATMDLSDMDETELDLDIFN